MMPMFSPLRIGLLAGLALVTIAGFVMVPAGATLPIHWGLDGQPDAFASRDIALLMAPLVAVVVWALFLLLPRLAPAQQMEAGRRPLRVALTGITALALLLQIGVVLIGAGVGFDMVQALAIALGLLFFVIGNALPKSQPNGVAGIRIPSTLRSAANWQATHRLTGVLSMVGGVVLIVAALLVPAGMLMWWVLGCVLLPFVIGVAYSISVERRSS